MVPENGRRTMDLESSVDTLTSEDLYSAGEEYGHTDVGNREYDALVLRYKDSTDPELLANAGIVFLVVWGAWPYPKKPVTRISVGLPDWVRSNISVVGPLRNSELVAMNERDFASVRELATGLSELGMGPTAWGKFLHWLMPRGIAMWDEMYVQTEYSLGKSPEEFVRYQSGLQRALQGLVSREGPDVVRKIEERHAEAFGCHGRIPKILDEAVYHDGIRQKLRSLMGPVSPA
jgi:hypothetical protein